MPGVSRVAGLATALVAIVGVAATSAHSQPTRHRLELTDRIGSVSRYRLVFEMRMTARYTDSAAADGEARRLLEALAPGLGLRTMMEYEQRLADMAEDGTRVFEVRWHDFEMAGDVGGREIPRPADHLASAADLLSRPARVFTTPTGRTLEVVYSHPRLAEVGRGLRHWGRTMPTYLPDDRVAVGDRWSSTVRFPVGLSSGGLGEMTIELEHTLRELREGPDGPEAVIDLSGDYSRLQGIEESATGAPIHLQARLTGWVSFGIDQGRFTGGEYDLEMFALTAPRGIEIELTGHAEGGLELIGPR